MTELNIQTEFPGNCGDVTFYRTYSRPKSDGREKFKDTLQRCLSGIFNLGNFTEEEQKLLREYFQDLISLPSGRWLWVGGTEWLEEPENWSGAYNCKSLNINALDTFPLMMDLAMQGCGTGANLESFHVDKLPPVRNHIQVGITGDFGSIPKGQRLEESQMEEKSPGNYLIKVGDSRKGWTKAYYLLLILATSTQVQQDLTVTVDISNVRPPGERLKRFGGTSNPFRLKTMFPRIGQILNGAVGRQLTSEECCLLIDEAAMSVVAGNIRRSAGIRQFDKDHPLLKLNLWQADEEGNFRIDPKREALQMANHTRVWHEKPTYEEIEEAVRLQVECGEGAIQYAPEAIARANADLLDSPNKKQTFLDFYNDLPDYGFHYLLQLNGWDVDDARDRVKRYSLNPCSEIIGNNLACNLSECHTNRLDPNKPTQHTEAMKAIALWVVTLLERNFTIPYYKESRNRDPIVGASVTGLFDFFVHLFGVDWLRWWQAGRPDNWTPQKVDKATMSELALEKWEDANCDHLSDFFHQEEAEILSKWREVVEQTVHEYCQRNGLKEPNRATTVKPSGTQSLLTNASPGWHPPKAIRYIRRITVGREDQIGLAAKELGFNIVPSQSSLDEDGNLLDDIYHPNCNDWLIEIPVKVPWADLPGVEEEGIDPYHFNVRAQFDFYMTVQKYWARHNTSSTLELTTDEIGDLAKDIYDTIQNDEGYISAAILQKFDPKTSSFPRLPFEPISEEEYQKEVEAVNSRQRIANFYDALKEHEAAFQEVTGPAGCDSEKCTF
jgi:ribonucleotide reductase class II